MVTSQEDAAPEPRRRAAGRSTCALLLALAICTGSLGLWRSPLEWYCLKLDDFVYLARSRTAASLEQHLLAPHNGHVVPLFLLQTHILARLAGSLEATPRWLSWASYGTLVAAIALVGHIVAWETGKAALGLAAMAAAGFSTVLGPAILWYAAGQALEAGVVILVMLAALQGWRARGSPWLLALGILAAAAAPLFWTAGYTAGLAGLAYLASDGRRACRLASGLPILGSSITGLVVWWLARPAATATSAISERVNEILGNLSTIGTHISQAICEALVISNLGLDAATSAGQSVILLGIVVVVWIWSRGGLGFASSKSRWRLNPLEAAGATLIISNLALIFAARGPRMTYDNLRALGWYHAIPELGAVLFAAGWWTGRTSSPPPRSIAVPQFRDLAGVALFAAIMFLMQAPRAERVTFQYDGAASEIFSGARATAPRTKADLAKRARRQRKALAELDKVERMARESGTDGAKLLESRSFLEVPGMPTTVKDFGVAELLDLSQTKTRAASELSPQSAPDGNDHE